MLQEQLEIKQILNEAFRGKDKFGTSARFEDRAKVWNFPQTNWGNKKELSFVSFS